ncbi:MAG: hypothetical protein DWP94_04505 [Flavobacterium sp.]|nr:MAG: hypothetical protein DWP94_04505 [Flavobacterium sp.]
MAFVVLFSTMSFTVNMHYCGDTLIDTAIFKKVDGCGMEMDKSSIEGCSITKKNCCDDEQVFIQGQDELKISIDHISFEQQVFLTSYIYSYINLFQGEDKNVISFERYKPPLVVKQIYKIDESYLI